MHVDDPPWEDLVRLLPTPVSVVDPHGRQLVANEAYATFLGYDADETAALDVGQITRPQDAAWTRTYLRRLVGGEIDEFTTDKIFVRRDGSEVRGRLSARAIRDDDGVCTMIIASIEPVSDRREASRARTNRLLGFTGDRLTVVDAHGTVIEASGEHSEVLGYPTTFWSGRNVGELVAPHDLDRLADLRDRVLSRPGTDLTSEFEVLGADGSPQTLLVRAVNLLDDDEIGGIVLVTRNVTEYRATLTELAQRSVDAESIVDAQTRLLATVSHELRNPLHAVRGLAELLASEELPERATELATSLVRQLSGLAQVTQDLLDAARLDAGKVAIETAPTDLHALVDDVVALGRAAAGDRELDVSSRITHDVPRWVNADVTRLRQVLGNLVGNAVKFTADGSVQLVVRVGQNGVIVFSVIDTGVGIPPEEQSRILEPFAVASNSGRQRGAGLGLSIVHRLVTAMGGAVALTSVPDEGSRFDVTVPLAATDAPDSSTDGGVPAGLVILVVEDNPVNQQLATSQLERLGLIPVIAGTGEAGLELLADDEDGCFDAVLMDHQLPGISGIETTQRIRAMAGPVAAIPVIGLSASASSADRDAFVAAGMDDFLAKPASLDDLSGAIGRAARGESGRSEAPDRSPTDDDGAEPTGPGGADPAEPAVDRVVLDRLVADFGGESIVVELVDTFLGELDDRVAAIVGAADDHGAGRAAHALKSSARLLGAGALADACQAIEAEGAAAHDVTPLADAVRAELSGWRSSRAPG